MTGSRTTMGVCGSWSSHVAVAVAASEDPIMPILMAWMVMSSDIARSCSLRNSVGGVCIAVTPQVFCAVRAVIAAMP
ncbi:hypothetical protein FRC0205_02280 [Corynebacterium diphtheriae]|nr:hypothetical protein FRC0205_02280 [Corynebacterium diphtheriae]